MWMTHPQVPPPATLLRESDHYPTYHVDRYPLLTSTSGTHSLRSSVRPGYTQTDVTHPGLWWGGANVGLRHLGRIPNCSEVPDTCFLWYFVQFFFFFC